MVIIPDRIFSRLRTLLVALTSGWWKRNHWFAEFWSSLALMSVGLTDFIRGGEINHLVMFHYVVQSMPSGLFDSIVCAIGFFQLLGLTEQTRWWRGVAAFLSFWIYFCVAYWVSMSIGFVPGSFSAAWAGVNGFALFRQLRGY